MLRKLESKLATLADLIETYLPLAEAHNTEFFAEEYWDKLVPDDFKSNLESLTPEKLSNLLSDCCSPGNIEDLSINESVHSLELFVSIVKCHTLPYLDILTDLKSLYDAYNGKPNNVEVPYFMTDKKYHETYEMSEVIFCLCKYHNINQVIDIGSGKGYLSNFLTLNYNLNVLGIEGNESINESASHREIKLTKYWDGLKAKAVKKSNQNNDGCLEKHGVFHRETCYVTPNLDLDILLKEKFSTDVDNLAIVGLHTCGSLANSIIELFMKQNRANCLVNVACCYQHILPEEFPLSSSLRKRNFQLNRFVNISF